MSYSLNFRKKVLHVREEEGLSLEAVAQRFGIGKATVFRWTKKLEPELTRCKPATKIDMAALLRDIQLYPDAYQHERAKRLCVSKAGIWYALKRLNVTYKKNPDAPQGGPRKTLRLLPDGQGV